MSATTTGPLFRSTSTSARNKAEETTAAARSIIDAEASAREAKTLRLRKLRIEKEQEVQANELPVAAPKRKAAKTTRKKS